MSGRALFVRVSATVPGRDRRPFVQLPIFSGPGVTAELERWYGKPWITGLVADMVAGLQARLEAEGIDVAGVEWRGRIDVAFLCGGRAAPKRARSPT